MTYEEAYREGFAKTAEDMGINPEDLAKVAELSQDEFKELFRLNGIKDKAIPTEYDAYVRRRRIGKILATLMIGAQGGVVGGLTGGPVGAGIGAGIGALSGYGLGSASAALADAVTRERMSAIREKRPAKWWSV